MTSLTIIYLGLIFILFAQGYAIKERNRRAIVSAIDIKCRRIPGFKIERYDLGGKMCLMWSNNTKNFTDAKAECEAQGTRLGIFKGAAKMQILFRQKDFWKRNIWIGLDDLVTNGTFVWHDGTILPRSDYYPLYFGSYNPSGKQQRCIQLWTWDNKLDDVECYDVIYYVCEKVF
ncbi:C-type lectin domain family 4 member M [Biomphalaria pfeifferi]|uniref:C-type lectin domain family 4 member M n=1 Tax=Biomphalaria pfeifferi TaxID=112525 RepID=A0AAD8AVG1_BIOPF|nr:C-type lectin domain family 4 member M [Biomphalaria pfeifferi]